MPCRAGRPGKRWLTGATLAGLSVAPDRLAERLHGMWRAPSATAAAGLAEPLLTETVDLAEQATGLRLAEFRELLAERRDVIDPPSAGLLLLE
jgi:hypothetical protein